MKFEDQSLGDSVLELTTTTLGVYYARNSESPKLHLAMLSVVVDDPDRKGRRTVHVQARPGAVGAYLRLDWGWPEDETTGRRLQEYLMSGMTELHLYHLGLLGHQGMATMRRVIETTRELGARV